MKRHLPALHRGLAVVALSLLAALPAHAWDANWSGFGTLGYARSNSDDTYQRFINRKGSFAEDSLIAGQLDLRASPQWSSTVQIKAAPSVDHDSAWTARAAWAFIAWRPDNDWLVRLGRARVPLYLYSESLDVGVATDMARLPIEMYSISPSNDFNGLFVTRNLNWGERDLSIDAYTGQSDATARLWLRDGLPPYIPAGPLFQTVKVRLVGLALTVRDSEWTWRLGLHATRTRNVNGGGLPVSFPFVSAGPGVGYWKVSDAEPGQDIPYVDAIRNLILTGGAEWRIAEQWRLVGEFVDMHQYDTELGSDSRAGYLALFRRIGACTPYVSAARQRSSSGLLGWHANLVTPTLPSAAPGAAQSNALQRMAGESLYAFDQRSLALGLSYALSPTAKLKAEWMRTEVGAASGHFDVPAGMPDVQGLHLNTLSLNLSLAF